MEILSGGVLRTSRRAQRGELPRITIFLYSRCLPTPSELRDRFIWRRRGEFCWKSTPDQGFDRPLDDQIQVKNRMLFLDISELSGPFGFIFYSFEALISTIEPPSISSIGPLTMKIFYFLYLVTGHPVRCHIDLMLHSGFNWSMVWDLRNVMMVYLHRQLSDGADTLQFDSTG